MIKLLPCPFCGHVFDNDDMEDVIYPLNHEETIWNIFCNEQFNGCGASILGNNEQDCIEKWNYRI